MELARSAAAVPQDEAQPWIPRLPSDKTQHGQREARLGDGVSIGTVVVGCCYRAGILSCPSPVLQEDAALTRDLRFRPEMAGPAPGN